MRETSQIEVYLELGAKRTVASAVAWAGWTRVGHDEESSLQALVDYAPRYARALHHTGLSLQLPTDLSEITVVERLTGNASTDFGAPGVVPSADSEPVDEAELTRLQALLTASWAALDAASTAAAGRELRRGPRGGGRELGAMLQHVLESEQAYLAKVGRRLDAGDTSSQAGLQARTRAAITDGLLRGVREGIPPAGPRGGSRWPARYFVRRVSWHALDHAWEIEDRIV
jgi:hypothetical protein